MKTPTATQLIGIVLFGLGLIVISDKTLPGWTDEYLKQTIQILFGLIILEMGFRWTNSFEFLELDKVKK